MRFMILAILFAITGCRTWVDTTKASVADTGDTGSESDTDTDTDTDADTDTGDDTGDTETGDETDLELEVQFSTVFSASVHFEVQPGDEINFGTWIFDSVTDEEITVEDITMMSYVDVDDDGVFSTMEEGGVSAANYLSNCYLIEWPSLIVVMGPMEIDEFGAVNFTDDFIVGGEYTTALNLRCTLSEDAEELEFASFAFDIQTLDVHSTANTVTWLSHNMDYVDGEATMTLAAYVQNCSYAVDAWVHEDVEGTIRMGNELAVSLSSSTPSGLAVPGYMEILRVNMSALHSGCSDLTVGDMGMDLAVTDIAETNWYEEISTVAVVDLTTGEDLGQGIVFDGIFVAFASGMGDYEGITIQAGTSHTIAFYADTTGASVADDDAFRATLRGGINLSDDGESFHSIIGDGDIVGSTLVF
ncbi:MAG: hypothetical protein Q8P30_04625 [Candidatus Uhrbacteria bacterium]|nr:hypothetical protein [Candidatus Uhrbacteria bacterium]